MGGSGNAATSGPRPPAPAQGRGPRGPSATPHSPMQHTCDEAASAASRAACEHQRAISNIKIKYQPRLAPGADFLSRD